MKYLKRHNKDRSPKLIREFNEKHRNEILDRGSEFTISYEIELESRSQHTDFYDLLEQFNSIFEPLVKKWDLDVDYDNSLIDTDIPQVISLDSITSFDDYDFGHEEQVHENATYFSGIEIAPFTYFKGVNEAFRFLDEFYIYYERQKSFHFSENTGLHINIGFHNKKSWNLIKGYLLFNEDKMAYLGFNDRRHTEFAGIYKKEFEQNVKDYLDLRYKDNKSNEVFIKDINAIISDLNRILVNTVSELDEKTVGFNITKVKDNNYIEFRHPGGKVNKEDIEDQTLHYANIVLACVDTEYRKKNFYNKLLNFLNKLSN